MNRIADEMFGRLEPVEPHAVLMRVRERAKDALVEQGALVQAQLDRLAESEVAIVEGVRTALADAASNIDKTTRDLPRADEPSRVVLLGRTQAGKSTLFQYLTGSEQSVIGLGAQRTTTEVFYAPLRFAASITVADTPGVGAKDGDEDLRRALEEARKADLLIWVATTNSLQEQTRFALDLVASWGTPLILAVNCLEDIAPPEAQRIFLKYPSRQPVQVLAAEPGHVLRATETLDQHGQAALRVIPVHAQAAQLSLVAHEDGPDLVKASGLNALVQAIHDELDGPAAFRRATATSDAVRLTCVEVAACVDGLAEELREWGVRSALAMADLARRAERLIDDAALKYAAAVRRRLLSLNDWADKHYADNVKELGIHWAETARVLEEDLRVVFESASGDLCHELDRLGTDVWHSWERTIRRASHFEGPKLTGRVNPTWLAPAAQGAAKVLGVVVGHLLSKYPPTMILAPIAPMVLTKGASKIFGGRERQLRKRRASLTSQMLSERSRRQAAAEAEWRAFSRQLTEVLLVAQAVSKQQQREAERNAAQLLGLARDATQGVLLLDHALCLDLLQLDGRCALANEVSVVRRQPGAVATIGLRGEQALLEAYLRPPHHLGDARYYNDAPDVSAGRKIAHTLALGTTKSRIVRRSTGYSVERASGITAAKVAAESRMASDVAGCAVEITTMEEVTQ